jgi:phosphohistidine phosphatase
MLVILIRHGAAAPDSPLGDSGRALTPLGRRQAEATGRALAAHAVRPTQVWTSPLVRAVQTAELVVMALSDYQGPVEARDDLFPDSPFESLTHALTGLEPDATIVVVGHQPYMATTASRLLGYSVSSFGTGSAYALRLSDPPAPQPRAELDWRWPD